MGKGRRPGSAFAFSTRTQEKCLKVRRCSPSWSTKICADQLSAPTRSTSGHLRFHCDHPSRPGGTVRERPDPTSRRPRGLEESHVSNVHQQVATCRVLQALYEVLQEGYMLRVTRGTSIVRYASHMCSLHQWIRTKPLAADHQAKWRGGGGGGKLRKLRTVRRDTVHGLMPSMSQHYLLYC